MIRYYTNLKKIINKIFPEKITWENCENYNFNLNYKHPEWVKSHFPLMLILHREKAGALRKSKSISVMYQNQTNVAVQIIPTADNYGGYLRKLEHKGFSEIVAAISLEKEDVDGFYSDMFKMEKFRNFMEFYRIKYPGNIKVKALCEILEREYPSDSIGQLKLI